MPRVHAYDVSALPSYAFHHRSMLWWGTLGFVAIEATVFALTIAGYFYLASQNATWPASAAPPDLLWGTLNLAILLLSAVPNEWTKRAAERRDLRRTRWGMIACLAFGAAFLAVRAMEFGVLNVWWDANAYGSIVWALLVLHATHLLTDVADTAVLCALFFIGPIAPKRFVDASENCFYWYFVVASWLPIYATIYWAPRLL